MKQDWASGNLETVIISCWLSGTSWLIVIRPQQLNSLCLQKQGHFIFKGLHPSGCPVPCSVRAAGSWVPTWREAVITVALPEVFLLVYQVMAGGFYPPICKFTRRFGGRAGGWLIHCLQPNKDYHLTLNIWKKNHVFLIYQLLSYGDAMAWISQLLYSCIIYHRIHHNWCQFQTNDTICTDEEAFMAQQVAMQLTGGLNVYNNSIKNIKQKGMPYITSLQVKKQNKKTHLFTGTYSAVLL